MPNEKPQSLSKFAAVVMYQVLDTDGDGFFSESEMQLLSAYRFSAFDTILAEQTNRGTKKTFPTLTYETPSQSYYDQVPKMILPSTIIIHDRVIFGTRQLVDNLEHNPSYSGLDIKAVLKEAFPNGVADVKLSEACQSFPALNCTAMRNGKLLISSETAAGI